jgi:hypothetical protein
MPGVGRIVAATPLPQGEGVSRQREGVSTEADEQQDQEDRLVLDCEP